MATALMAAGGGPLAMAAAFPIGFVAGASFAPTSLMGAACFAWNSIGPRECACFPKECAYDEVLETCAIQQASKAPSSNPFGRALPYMSMKCVPNAKAERACD